MRLAFNLVVALLLLALCLGGCARTEGALNQVLMDFGLRPRPEGEKVDTQGDIDSRLSSIKERELVRLNVTPANTEVRFEEIPGNPLGLGQFYKTVKVYEKAYTLEIQRERAQQVQRAETLRERGYRARVEYRYRIYRGKKFPSSDEARDSVADIETEDCGREMYIYHFDENGVWDGKPGRFERGIVAPNDPAVPAQRYTPESDVGEPKVKQIQVGGSVRIRAESRDVVDP